MPYRMFLIILLLTVTAAAPGAAELFDGRLFDPGIERTAPAESAPAELAELQPFLGDWDLQMEIYRQGQDTLRSKGVARWHYMNRGHGVMERIRVADFDGQGNAMATIAFYVVDGNGIWTVSEGNSWTQAIRVYSGALEKAAKGSDAGPSWVFHDAFRPGGGTTLLMLRRTYQNTGKDRFEMRLELSQDLGASWAPAATQRYQRRSPCTDCPDPFPVRDDIGQPAADRPPEAGQFDFLLGEFDATHWLQSPQGEVRWQANATAVHVLDGHAILEFSWHNQDPNRPDVATTILRLYNHSMRRWESLFLTNRSNTPLHFGGVQEGSDIVLHPFQAQTGSNPLSQWIFFEPRKDTYRWKGLRSQDRGKSFAPYWTIEFARKGVEAKEAAAPAAAASTEAGK